MTLALLCPTRGRPEQCKRMIDSARATADKYVNIFIGISERDAEIYNLHSGRYATVLNMYQPDFPTCHKWNMLAAEVLKNPYNKLFMLAADDMIFETPGWDKALLDHYNALENKIHVYALQDSRDPDGTPHPIITREYIEAMGYFLPPIFLHWYVDSWTVEIAKANNCFTHLREYKLIHDKPSDKGNGDETHNRIRRMGWRERDAYVDKTCGHFLEFEKRRLAEKLAA